MARCSSDSISAGKRRAGGRLRALSDRITAIPNGKCTCRTADAGLEVRLPVKAGTRDVTVSFVKQYYETTGILQPPQRGFARSINELYHGHPAVDTVLIGGPYAAAGPGDTPSRRRVFTAIQRIALSKRPARSRFSRTSPVEPIVVPLLRRISSDCSASYEAGRAEGGFEAGIQRGIERILASPSFLFRIEEEPVE